MIKPGYKTISREELRAKLDRRENIILVNVLGAESFRRAHIPGSISVPVSEIEQRAGQLGEKNQEIIVYCASFQCHASPIAAEKLVELGFSDVTDYEGGISDWMEAGFPVEGGEAAA